MAQERLVWPRNGRASVPTGRHLEVDKKNITKDLRPYSNFCEDNDSEVMGERVRERSILDRKTNVHYELRMRSRGRSLQLGWRHRS